jgi:uncharacterized protein
MGASQAKAELGPAATKARLEVLDALRGFALCGILLINLPSMAWLMDSNEPVPGVRDGDSSTFVWWFGQLFVHGTMRGLFSLLFGASMLLFLAKAERGSATRAEANVLMLRRLFWLFMFGVVDMSILLWPGDILNIYAMAGLVALPFATARKRTLAIAAALVLIGVTAFMVSQQLPKRDILAQGPVLEAQASSGHALAPPDEKKLERWRKWQTGKYATGKDIAKERTARLGGYISNFVYLGKMSWEWLVDWKATLRWVFDAVGFMLVGMVLYRLGWLQAEAARRSYAMLALIGYGLGLPLRGIEALAEWRLFFGGGVHFWQFLVPALVMQTGRLLVTCGHVALFLWCWKAIGWKLAPLQALGRMAFSGYLMQSILGALAFSGFGLALWGKFDLTQIWLCAAVIWLIEIVLAMLWLSCFSMGPFEWIWRSLTYGRAPQLRAGQPQAVAT